MIWLFLSIFTDMEILNRICQIDNIFKRSSNVFELSSVEKLFLISVSRNNVTLSESNRITFEKKFIKYWNPVTTSAEKIVKEILETTSEKAPINVPFLTTTPVIGNWYKIPCLVNTVNGKRHIFPIIDHLHDDKENGQTIKHYHIDYRFDIPNVFINFSKLQIDINKTFAKIEITDNAEIRSFICENEIVAFQTGPRIDVFNDKKIEKFKEYIVAKNVRLRNAYLTPTKYLKSSKIKKCLKHNKCPHRGFDLSNVAADVNGVITCPLHNLKFKDNKLLPFDSVYYKEEESKN